MTAPEPFKTMPVVYENAFGGLHHFDPSQLVGPDSAVACNENPVGKGFVGKRRGRELNGLPLPNLESPGKVISSLGENVPVNCLAPVAPSWLPRVPHAGTYDSGWLKKRAPLLPSDFDPRFFLVGSHGLSFYNEEVRGGENLALINLSEENELTFCIPTCPLVLNYRIGWEWKQSELKVETINIAPDDNHLSLVWKSALTCPPRGRHVDSINVDFDRNAKLK